MSVSFSLALYKLNRDDANREGRLVELGLAAPLRIRRW